MGCVVVGCVPLEFDEDSENFTEITTSGKFCTVDGWTVAIFQTENECEPARLVAGNDKDEIVAGFIKSWSILEVGICGTHDQKLYELSYVKSEEE